MKGYLKQRKIRLTKKDIENMSVFFHFDSSNLTTTVFAHLPLNLKHHSIHVGAVAGLMAMYTPENALPEGMTRKEYANAVRYGSFYHDIGAYLVPNQYKLYPESGERFLREEISERALPPATRKIILETVKYCCERYDGQGFPDRLAGNDIPLYAGICAIANMVDTMIPVKYSPFKNPLTDAKEAVMKETGKQFSSEAVGCFIEAFNDIGYLYKCWRKKPPIWKSKDIDPMNRPIDHQIG